MRKNVFLFSEAAQLIRNISTKQEEENLKTIFGGKGFHLAKISLLGFNVPEGFIITTEVCRDYFKNNQMINVEVLEEINDNIKKIEEATEKKFSIKQMDFSAKPLLVSVRSGAPQSMPGMMDTILNLGLNDFSTSSLFAMTNDQDFVNNLYFKFIQMFSNIVKGIPNSRFDDLSKKTGDIYSNSDISDAKKIYESTVKKKFPNDTDEQLKMAISAVFNSWENPRAKFYRRLNSINDETGTAVVVQSMVFGNFNDYSGTGVAFSRNPITGQNEIFGEYLPKAQGEDIVSGVRTPLNIESLNETLPNVYVELLNTAKSLENSYKDIQDIEFTIENNKLYILQTRSAKRSSKAAVKFVVDLVDEGKITKKEALLRISTNELNAFMHPEFSDKDLKTKKVLCKGFGASLGAASGMVIFDTEEAKFLSKTKSVVLVKKETSPEDIEGMQAAAAVLTTCGGMTSHAAVVARGMGRCCVVGCGNIEIHKDYLIETSSNTKVKKGDIISLDGSSGFVYLGQMNTIRKEASAEFNTFMTWVNEICPDVYANADNVQDIKQAVKFGAKGIGLCRTEHMFFKEERIKFMRELILSKTYKNRKNALDKLIKFQVDDFVEMFLEIRNSPIIIRLLDPPFHEFLPHTEESQIPIADDFGIELNTLKSDIEQIKEFNPMMGHRGVRLYVSYPEIAKMQTTAIINAAFALKKMRPEANLIPQIMIPFISDEKELKFIKNIIEETANLLILKEHIVLEFKIGIMIELPRAALIAEHLSPYVSFFSFGTNDLTQMTYGLSRDDASKFLNNYYDKKIFEKDPFSSIDVKGVGSLIKTAVKLGRSTNSKLKIGVCGEHGGDSDSIDFFEKVGIDYVSCSPFRIPGAKLAYAKARLRNIKS